MAFFLPLGILDFEAVENAKSDLWRIRNISAGYPLTGIRSDVRKSAMVMFMSEVLFRTVRDGGGDKGLYDWCKGAILTLDALESDFSNYHLRFLLEYAFQLGFAPSADALMPFAGPLLAKVSDLLNSSLEDFLLYPLSGRERSEIAEVILKYLSCHMEITINVKSLSVLGELFR